MKELSDFQRLVAGLQMEPEEWLRVYDRWRQQQRQGQREAPGWRSVFRGETGGPRD